MPDFFDHCKELDLDPFYPEMGIEVPVNEGSVKRAGVRAYAYPPQYSRGQYPREYFRPIAADAATFQSDDTGRLAGEDKEQNAKK